MKTITCRCNFDAVLPSCIIICFAMSAFRLEAGRMAATTTITTVITSADARRYPMQNDLCCQVIPMFGSRAHGDNNNRNHLRGCSNGRIGRIASVRFVQQHALYQRLNNNIVRSKSDDGGDSAAGSHCRQRLAGKHNDRGLSVACSHAFSGFVP